MKIGLFLIFFVMISATAFGHARLKASNELKIRSSNAGVKNGPCGGYTKAAPAELQGGQSITVNWEETIYHPGRFEFYFSATGDSNFTLLKTVVNDQQAQQLPHQFTTTLTLPNVACTNCTFQMIQVMEENPAAPSNYYSCADMRLTSTNNTPTPKSPICP